MKPYLYNHATRRCGAGLPGAARGIVTRMGADKYLTFARFNREWLTEEKE